MICMFYVLCETIDVIKHNKLIYVTYIGVIISVYVNMFINNNISEHIVIRRIFETVLVYKPITTSVVYWCVYIFIEREICYLCS